MLPRLYVSAGVETTGTGSGSARAFDGIGMPANLRAPTRPPITLAPNFMTRYTATVAAAPSEVKKVCKTCNIYRHDLSDLKKRELKVPLPEP